MTESEKSLLLVDDDVTFRSRFARAFTSRGYVVREAGSADEAIRLAREESPELAVVDLKMEGASGLDVVKRLHAIDPTTRIVILTGYGSIATAVDAVRLGAVDYLQKPADVDQVILALERGDDSSSSNAAQVPSLARVEWEHIQRVVSDCGGNLSAAAKLLGIHRRSLQRKLAKYPVSR